MKRAAALLALLCLMLSGCSFSLYEGEKPPVHTVPSASDISESASLVCTGELTDDSEKVIATYEASVPQFDTVEGREDAFTRINDFYKAEANALSQDMQSFFDYVKRLSDKKELTAVSHVSFSYELMPCDPKYICVSRLYSISENGAVSSHPTAQVFLTDTGWRLSFKELFGENTEKALSVLKNSLAEWCIVNGLSDVFLPELDEEYLDNRFGMTEENFFICFDPFFTSAADYDYHIALLDLDPFRALFN